jgi:4'-phosphopantetheinyl transferase
MAATEQTTTMRISHVAGTPDFESGDMPGCLPGGEIHVWLWQMRESLAPRAVAALAREHLLRLLPGYAGCEAPPLVERGEHGKPFVLGEDYPHFNLSHGGECIALAFSRDHELGVDVENTLQERRHEPLELARRFFAAEESHALARLEADARNAAFMHLWTCKEAVLKAIGHGLSFGLDRLQFTLDGEGRPDSLRSIAEEAGAPEEWQIHRFEPAPGHAGSLAWRGPECRLRWFRLEDATSRS